jgi:hypothetical protein
MLNRFQTDIIKYLDATADHFVQTLMEKNNKEFIVIDNLTNDLTSYLGHMIKRDLYLHDEKSEGYNKLEDMLIEIHIAPNKEFEAALLRTALKPIRCRSL